MDMSKEREYLEVKFYANSVSAYPTRKMHLSKHAFISNVETVDEFLSYVRLVIEKTDKILYESLHDTLASSSRVSVKTVIVKPVDVITRGSVVMVERDGDIVFMEAMSVKSNRSDRTMLRESKGVFHDADDVKVLSSTNELYQQEGPNGVKVIVSNGVISPFDDEFDVIRFNAFDERWEPVKMKMNVEFVD